VLDMMMPGRSGIEVVETLRADAELRGTLVVMLTASTQPQHRAAAERAGADRFVAKPFSPIQLELLVQTLLERAT
jgi:CheY-like chemotaxis protein